MQVIGHQLGELFLQAVPTVLIILLFYFILRAVFFKPLLAVMAERDARTVGAETKETRARAAGEVSRAKTRVAAELAAARRDVESTVAELSAEIARHILETPPRPGAPAREAR